MRSQKASNKNQQGNMQTLSAYPTELQLYGADIVKYKNSCVKPFSLRALN